MSVEAAVSLRAGGEEDLAFVVGVAEEAFADLGDYGRLLSEWVRTPGVEATIAEQEGAPAGFSLLAFFPSRRAPGALVAELLAIAVAPSARGRGLGRRLLAGALARSRAAARGHVVTALGLSVAEDNGVARRLFEGAGFEYVGSEDRFYPRGQRALHMRLTL